MPERSLIFVPLTTNIYEFGIVGMGPAGIGVAMELKNTTSMKDIVCFERGSLNSSECFSVSNNVCCCSDVCNVISGVGGASTFSSGKISDFPAGSGLTTFFDSEYQLRELLNHCIQIIDKGVGLRKICIDESKKNEAYLYYKEKQIEYKYYDVYEFDGDNYRLYLKKTVQDMMEEGLQLYHCTEVVKIQRDPSDSYYQVHARISNGEIEISVRNLIIATGALDPEDNILEAMHTKTTSRYEIGVRIEAPSESFKDVLSTHGDLKLKYDKGRTYCVTQNGIVLAYQTKGVRFLEGCANNVGPTGCTNLAILIKQEETQMILDFLEQYRKKYRGTPIVQRYIDYKAFQKTSSKINASFGEAQYADINELFPDRINREIKCFIKDVLIEAMGIPENMIVMFAPELKVLHDLQINSNFEVKPRLYIIGAATGKFRGILQSFCSGIRCGQLLATYAGT